MRCVACDKPLKNREATRKGLFSGEYLDLCDECYDPIQYDCPTTDNPFHSGYIETKEIASAKQEISKGEEGESEGNDTPEH